MPRTNFIPIIPFVLYNPVEIELGRDVRHGFGTQAAFPLFFKLPRHPIMRALHCEENLSFVFADNVSKDIIKGASKLAGPV